MCLPAGESHAEEGGGTSAGPTTVSVKLKLLLPWTPAAPTYGNHWDNHIMKSAGTCYTWKFTLVFLLNKRASPSTAYIFSYVNETANLSYVQEKENKNYSFTTIVLAKFL